MNPDSLPDNPKHFTLEEAVQIRNRPEYLSRKIVLTNGCFDLLHPGHIYFLREAAKLGSQLWVALNGDQSVRALKGPARPVLSEAFRAYSLAALDCVAGIFLFQSDRLQTEIEAFKPDLYAKAGDYALDSLDPGERRALDQAGTQIHFLPFLEGFSTTGLVSKIQEAAGQA